MRFWIKQLVTLASIGFMGIGIYTIASWLPRNGSLLALFLIPSSVLAIAIPIPLKGVKPLFDQWWPTSRFEPIPMPSDIPG